MWLDGVLGGSGIWHMPALRGRHLLLLTCLAPPPAVADGDASLCWIGCWQGYGWEGCTLDRSRPPGCEQCLYVNNARLTPNKDNPMLRQCEAMCLAREYQYYALQDESACYCGRGTLLADKQQADTECAPCPDLPGQLCGAMGKGKLAVYALASVCPAGRAAGWLFSAAVVSAAVLYLAVGTALRHRRTGVRGLQALPHRERWLQVYGLVMDGVQFTRSVGSGRRSSSGGNSYTRVSAGRGVASRDDDSSGPGPQAPRDQAHRTHKGKSKSKRSAAPKVGGSSGSNDASLPSPPASATSAPSATTR